MSIEDYQKAGKIAAEVREDARKHYHVGETLLQICEHVEGMIREKGAEPAFPCNVSLNEVAAHYTAEPNDEGVVRDGDVLKIDIGVHVNGFIADTAVTVCYNPSYDSLVNATELVLQEAVRIVRAGVKASEIGKVVETATKRFGFRPIHNLSGHSLAQYTIHAGKSIPNIWTIGSFSLLSNEAYAIEPFLTMKDGSGVVYSGKAKNIFAIATRKRTGNKDADAFFDELWKRFRTLPFALRWLVRDHDDKEVRQILEFLIKKKLVRAYPILVERNGKFVAQAEHTLIPMEGGAKIVTLAS
ncbi:MAG: type II methionyl aminopeptidase [Nitrososphaerales archaeon]